MCVCVVHLYSSGLVIELSVSMYIGAFGESSDGNVGSTTDYRLHVGR